MFSTKITSLWSSGVRRFLKPSELVRGLMSAYRMVIAPLEDIPLLGKAKAPSGHGSLYKVITLPLVSVQPTAPVAGIDNFISGGTVSVPEFPYMITGAPSGIISFAKCVDSKALLLYADFVEKDGVYYFTKDPTSYGIVSTSTGNPTITFTVSVPNENITNFQDTETKYCGSGDFTVNSGVRYWDAFEEVLPSSGALALQSCGVTTSLKSDKLKQVWIEGDSLFALTENGAILKDAASDSKEVVGSSIKGGEPLTKKAFTSCRIYPYAGSLYCLLDTEDSIAVSDTNLSEVMPEFSGSTVSYSVVNACLDKAGFITVIRADDYPAGLSSKAIDVRLNKLSSQYLVNFAEISVGNPESSYAYYDGSYIVPDYEDEREYSEVVPDVSNYNYIYVYYTTDRRKTVQPLCYRGIRPRQALFGNYPEFGVLRIPVQSEDGYKLALTDNGAVFNRMLKCGDIIKAISLVVNYTDERNYRDDAIVNHVTIPEIEVGAGGSAVLKLNWSE